MNIFDELTREQAPRITAPRRLVLVSGIFGRAAKDEDETSSYEEQRDDIIRYLSRHESRTQKLIARACQIHYRRVNEVLNRMKDEGLVTKVTTSRASPWKLTV